MHPAANTQQPERAHHQVGALRRAPDRSVSGVEVLDAARLALQHGFSVIPAAVDGTKAPWPDGPRWAQYQTARPTLEHLDRWFGARGRHQGMGLVCGAISGGLELLEFEGRAVAEGILDAFLHAADAAGLVDLVDRIADGFQEASPTGGVHWLMRITGAPVPGNTKLASRPATEVELEQDPKDRVKVLIETRGEGGFVIVAPSNGTTHPTGRPWEQTLGGFDTVATITAEERAELHELARLFDLAPEPAATTAAPSRSVPPAGDAGARPGDDYNSRSTWRDLLEPAGWTLLWERNGVGYWRRPGKPRGVSATTNALGTDRLKVFSSSTPFDTATTYDRFGAMALLQHGGDIPSAARALRSDGYGAETTIPPASPPAGHEEAAGDDDGRPRIIVNGRQLRDISTDFLDAVDAANQPPKVFVRSGQLTRVRLDEKRRPIVELLGESSLRNRLAQVADSVRQNKDGALSHVPPPVDVVRDLLAKGDWTLPPLEAVTEIPTVRPDGTINHAAGYDTITHIVHIPTPGLTVPPVQDHPDDDNLSRALALLDELVVDFPFDTEADQANTIACLLGPLLRPAIAGQIPMALIDAPEPGSGKGLIANITALIATGRTASMRPLPDTEDETRKMITSTLAEAPTVVVLDNVDEAIRSGALASLLTSDHWADRILGRSEIVTLPNRAVWMATGNNLEVAGDLARRCYRIRLDARQARPYTRTGFRHPDLPGWVLQHRGELLWALLTLARSWWAAGQPQADTPTLGGFTPWAHTMGGILHHAGINGFLANLHSFVESADREANAWEGFLAAWWEVYGARVVTAADIATEVESVSSELRPAMPDDLADAVGTTKFRQKLGLALRKRGGRHYGDEGLHLISHPHDRRRVALWSVEARDSRDVDTDGTTENVVPMRSRGAGREDLRDLPNPTHEDIEKSLYIDGKSPANPHSPARASDPGKTDTALWEEQF